MKMVTSVGQYKTYVYQVSCASICLCPTVGKMHLDLVAECSGKKLTLGSAEKLHNSFHYTREHCCQTT